VEGSEVLSPGSPCQLVVSYKVVRQSGKSLSPSANITKFSDDSRVKASTALAGFLAQRANDLVRVRPAFELLHQLGYKQVKALVIPSNLQADWADKGYPLQKGQ